MATSDLQSPSIQEPAGEYPRRYRWLKRVLLACAIVFVLLCLTEWWWWHAAQKRLDAAVAKLHAKGDPATVDDLQPEPMRDVDNAAYYLKQAASKISAKFDSPSNSNATFNDNVFPYSAAWFKMEEAAVANSPGFAADLREARRHPRATWTHITSPLLTVMLPHLGQCRQLANHAGDHAMLLHFQGNDAEAIETLNDLFAESRAIDQEPFLVSHLVATGIRALTTERLQLIAPALTVQGVSPTTNPSAHPASREQVQQLIAYLLDDHWRTVDAQRTFAAERVLQIDYVNLAANKQWVLRPMLLLDAAQSARSVNLMDVAGPLPNWPAADAALKRTLPTTNPARIVGRAVKLSTERAIETDYRVLEELRCTAVSLAVRLYRLDHAGALPPTLEALVPKYLPDVPRDPMAAGDKKLGYVVLNQGQRAVVYSVGENGIDDTAAGAAIPSFPNYGWGTRMPDQCHELLRWNPPPSTQPAGSGETSDD